MKKTLSILTACLLFSSWCFSQEPCTLASKVDTNRVNRRIGFYQMKKQRTKLQALNNSVSYTKASFVAMLQQVKKTAKWDGLRVYFAALPETNCTTADSACDLSNSQTDRPITYIFAPTTYGNKKGYHIDVPDTYWVLLGNDVKQIPSRAAKAWVNKAWQTYLSIFQADGKKHTLTNFKESQALWYSRQFIIDGKGDRCSILDYLTRPDNKTVSVDVYAGGFGHLQWETIHRHLPHDFYYQLTLLFYMNNTAGSFLGGDGGPVLSLVYPDLPRTLRRSKKTRDKFFAGAEQTYSDTGKPCPPPACQGAALLK